MARIARTISQPWTEARVGDELLAALAGGYTRLHARVGFVNASGVRHIAAALAGFRKRGGEARFVVGVDGDITSAEGVRALAGVVDELWLFHHPGRPLFHPKTYLFHGSGRGLALLGSANLTESALWVNYEDLIVVELDLSVEDDERRFEELVRTHQAIVAGPNAHLADAAVIASVEAMGLLPSEAERRRERHERDLERATRAAGDGGAPLFPPSAVRQPPAVPPLPEERRDAPPVSGVHRQFVLRLGHRDAGQQAGYSPDVFIPMAAYNDDSAFWGDLVQRFTAEGNEYWEREAPIEFRRASGSVDRDSRRLYRYPRKSEFRLNASQIHADSQEGDLLSIEIAAPGLGVDYVARVIKPSDPQFARYEAIASNAVRGSDKRWGYA
jgi:HKD family nuclease